MGNQRIHGACLFEKIKAGIDAEYHKCDIGCGNQAFFQSDKHLEKGYRSFVNILEGAGNDSFQAGSFIDGSGIGAGGNDPGQTGRYSNHSH